MIGDINAIKCMDCEGGSPRKKMRPHVTALHKARKKTSRRETKREVGLIRRDRERRGGGAEREGAVEGREETERGKTVEERSR